MRTLFCLAAGVTFMFGCGGGGAATTVTPASGPGAMAAPCAVSVGGGFTVAAADAEFVYGFGAGALVRMPAAGGAVAQLAPIADVSNVGTLALDGDFAYWTELGVDGAVTVLGHVWRVAKTGGEAIALATSDMPRSLALDGDTVYFTDRFGGVFSVPKAGGARTELVPNVLSVEHVAGGTAVAGGFVYFDESAGDTHVLRRVPASGGAAADVAMLPAFSGHVTAADGALFVGGGFDSDGVVRRVDPSSGAAQVVFAAGADGDALDFALDADFLYVATGARVVRLAHDGTHRQVLADSGARAIAVSPSGVFFGSVERACR